MIALATLVVGAAPASAHTVSGQGATNFRTTVGAISPATAGLTVRSIELGSRLELTWTGADPLVVLGYDDEPYLRIGPDGVFENRLSPATYLNANRQGGVSPPPDVSTKAPPQWVKISGGHTARWHDHRTHWMGGVTPPGVRRHPGRLQKVFDWHIGLLAGNRPVTITGTLDWVPASSALPWVVAVLVLIAAGTAIAAGSLWAPALLAMTAVLVATDVVHAVGTGLAFSGSTGHRVLLVIGSSYYSVVAWVLGIIAIRLLAKRSLDGLFAAVFTGLVVGLFGGLADVTSLSRSQIPFAFGDGVDRVLVTLSLGVGAGVVAGSFLAFRRNRVAEAPAAASRP